MQSYPETFIQLISSLAWPVTVFLGVIVLSIALVKAAKAKALGATNLAQLEHQYREKALQELKGLAPSNSEMPAPLRRALLLNLLTMSGLPATKDLMSAIKE